MCHLGTFATVRASFKTKGLFAAYFVVSDSNEKNAKKTENQHTNNKKNVFVLLTDTDKLKSGFLMQRYMRCIRVVEQVGLVPQFLYVNGKILEQLNRLRLAALDMYF